jgi:hypothetical protein
VKPITRLADGVEHSHKPNGAAYSETTQIAAGPMAFLPTLGSIGSTRLGSVKASVTLERGVHAAIIGAHLERGLRGAAIEFASGKCLR